MALAEEKPERRLSLQMAVALTVAGLVPRGALNAAVAELQ
jgi:hypothetical protein